MAWMRCGSSIRPKSVNPWSDPHHFACDGVSMLYDACSLVDGRRLGERLYLAVILPSETLILPHPRKFGASYE